ncbi:MAG: undecaprenyldiphospho-muramoylpentapeptide beta-N-acetylglucosaminyltransferase [Gammaproteobacteria bacterium]|nr:MAG: undecaprenyldiphospho-muramoylpentapeptide beta-N-acetylglucosaminyltransferase [Gammaproteobacteria bacterium]
MKPGGQGVLIMAGGTGGHVFPGLAVADALRQRDIPVRWLGAQGGMEIRKVTAAGIDLDLVAISSLRGKGLLRWIRMPLLLLRAVWQARRLLEANRPGCAVSFGGYVAAPGGIAAWTKGIPVLVHEQNRIPGLTNRLLARLSRKILQGFPDTFPQKMHPEDSGNPVRREVAAIAEPQSRLGSRTGPVRLLVTGGSQGARVLNTVVPEALALLAGNIRIEIQHQAGARCLDEALEAYASAGLVAEVKPFIDDMAEAYAWADLVISRSGALTVTELAAVGLGSVLVPFAHAVDDHQTRNAEYLSSAGAAILLPQASLDATALAAALTPLISDRNVLLSMAVSARNLALPDAAEKVVDACTEWLGT